MAFRSYLTAGRLLALAGALTCRGRGRSLAWTAHDALWLYPTLRRNCQWHGPVTTEFTAGNKEVWLTIDDGPDPRDTPEMLDLLALHQAKATFFVVGKKVEANRSLCRRILQEGHSLGNHTQNHRATAWWMLPGPVIRSEMRTCSEAILAATGTRPQLFRSPVGMTNAAVHPEAARQGMKVFGWSADGRDGCPAAPFQIVQRIRAGLQPGAIILLHEGGPSRRRALTLARLLEALSADGYQCVIPNESDF